MTFALATPIQSRFWYTLSMDTKQPLFESLYEKYALEIKRFLFTIARKDHEATNDIFQNTWINAWRYLGSLKEEGAARAWLYTIAKNEAKRFYSTHGMEPAFDPVYLDDDASGEDPQDEIESRFPEMLCDADQLKRLLAELSESDQQLILLHYAYGVTAIEIADLRGTNYNTVKSQLRRALAKLREAERQEVSI